MLNFGEERGRREREGRRVSERERERKWPPTEGV